MKEENERELRRSVSLPTSFKSLLHITTATVAYSTFNNCDDNCDSNDDAENAAACRSKGYKGLLREENDEDKGLQLHEWISAGKAFGYRDYSEFNDQRLLHCNEQKLTSRKLSIRQRFVEHWRKLKHRLGYASSCDTSIASAHSRSTCKDVEYINLDPKQEAPLHLFHRFQKGAEAVPIEQRRVCDSAEYCFNCCTGISGEDSRGVYQ